jgi:hypothetical protein
MRKIIRILIFFLLSIPGLKSQKNDPTDGQMHEHCAPCDLEYNKSLERGESSHCEQIKNTILLNECYIRVKCGNLPKRQEHIAHWKQEYAKNNCDDWAELNKIPPDDHCNSYQKLLSMYKRDRQGLEGLYGKENFEKMISRLEEDIALYCSNNSTQRSSQDSYAQEIEQGQAQRKATIVIETQNYLSSSQAARREYNEQQIKQWKQDLEKYNGASIGSELSASYYEEKYTDTKSSERIADRLLNHKLDDDEFSPGDIPAAESDNVFIRVSEEEIKRRIEQAKEETKKDRKEKEEKMCLQADDHYDTKCPIELRVDAWNNPLDQSAMCRFVRNNGTVLYQENGLIFRYLIYRAIESGVYHSVCAVDTLHYRHTSDRNLENDGRVFYFYNLYCLIENTSNADMVMFKTYPCINISMTGTDSNDMCDEWLCSGAGRFGNSAELSITSSPHIMHPSSSLVIFKGAWYPAEPKLAEWSVGRFDLKPFNPSKQ